jgi:hypothetical protein
MAINISSFAGAGAQFFTNNGDPLVGGLLYVYAAGTTTPATTFIDPSGTTNNTNPIVLNAGGRTPYQIWVNGGVLYKFVLKDSAGVTIGVYDNIPAIDDPVTFNNLITVTGTNTLLGTSTPPNTTYVAGMTLSFVVANTNTGPVTIDVDGLGAKEITVGTTNLIAGQLNAGGIAAIEYDGTRFQLMSVSGATTFTTVTATNVTTTNLEVSVITGPAGANTAQINGITPTAQSLQGFRNRIINGNMSIDQRNAGASVTPASGDFIVDRFKYTSTQTSKFTAQQNQGSVTPPQSFVNYLGLTSSSAYSILVTDAFTVQQSIEGFNAADLGWGAANAQSVTLSFWVRSSLTGTFGGALRNSANTRSYPFSYTITAANTWELETITIAGDTSGTWLTNSGVGVNIVWGLGVGSTLSGTAGAWVSSNFNSTTGAVSVVGTSGATFYVTGAQFEVGSIANAFERRDYGRELVMCQRYYEIAQGVETSSCPSPNTGGFIATSPIRYAAVKRAAGTVTLNGVAGANCASISVSSSNIGGFVIQNQATGTGNSLATYNWNTSAEL